MTTDNNNITWSAQTLRYSNIVLPSYTPGQIAFISWLQANRDRITVFDECTVSRKELIALLQRETVYVAVPSWIATPKCRRSGRGNYIIPEIIYSADSIPVNKNLRGRKAGSPNRKGRPPQPTAPQRPVFNAFTASAFGDHAASGGGK
jgi:hypothetical protein